MTEQELQARIFERIAETPSPTRSEVQRRTVGTVATGALLALIAFYLLGIVYFRHGFSGAVWDADQRAPMLESATFAGTVAIAIASLRLAFGRGGSMLGRPVELLVGVVVAAPVSLFAWKVGWSWLYASTAWWDDRPGFKCLSLSLLTAGCLFVSLIAARRGSDPANPGFTGAALGVASGSTSAVLLELWCPVGHPGHVLFGHVLPMLVYGGLGFLAGRRWLPWRPQCPGTPAPTSNTSAEKRDVA